MRREPLRAVLTSTCLPTERAREALQSFLRARGECAPKRCLVVEDGRVTDAPFKASPELGATEYLERWRSEVVAKLELAGVTSSEFCRLSELATQSQLRERLSGVDVFYLGPGNTYKILYEVERLACGDPHFWHTLLTASGMVFVGESAGAIAAGFSIETVVWKGWDVRRAVPESWNNLAGLNLLPNDASIFAHHAREWEDVVSARAGELPGPVLCLRDDEALVLEGDAEPLRLS
mmetsp:Transcript_11936/g.39293  ORF Transcript_11936/g.39293 Transcript_11936/m.39293 type:complete len:235 (+) Transcript_11936:48-752(+)